MRNTVTIKDIARESELSTATVSRVLNNSGYASDDVKERVHAAAKKLNYQPNAIARSLKNHRTNTIGVIMPDISNTYFMKISKGIEDTVYQSGYNLIFGSGDENPEKEMKMLKVLFEQRVDAVVLATSGESTEMIKLISRSNVPIILVDRKLSEKAGNLDFVVEGNVEGAYQLTSHLIKQGYTDIGLVNGSQNVSSGAERYKGFQKALKDNGLEENPGLVFNGCFTQEDGVKAVDYFLGLEKKPNAILSFNNMMTFGVMLRLSQLGYKIPEDFAIASYGEVEAAQLLKSPGMVTVEQSPYEMGVYVGQILLDRLVNNVEGPIQKVFSTQLHVDT